MRVWVDLANSPHVPVLAPVVRHLEARGDEVLITARDHAQTLDLARRRWPGVEVVGGSSPGTRLRKGASIGARAEGLRRFARRTRPDIALSHGSYAQIMAARAARVPAVTMMDYEHQPANHLSFRLARRVVVPELFPEDVLRRCGARARKVVRYPGFKEELYLGDLEPDREVLDELGLDPDRPIAVFRPPPEGALYHQMGSERFDDILERGTRTDRVQAVVLPRTSEQGERYRQLDGVRVPERAVDALSLLSFADVAVGGGGTMNREAALLGTPTYTVFVGKLAAVDAELIRRGLLLDLRDAGTTVSFARRERAAAGVVDGAATILARIDEALAAAVR